MSNLLEMVKDYGRYCAEGLPEAAAKELAAIEASVGAAMAVRRVPTHLVDTVNRGREVHRTSVYVIRVGDQWFSGFGGAPGAAPLTKLKPALCKARLFGGNGGREVQDYLQKLEARGHKGHPVRLVIAE